MESYSIKEECKHPDKLTRVVDSVGGCETTVEVCADCNKVLTKPKTEC